MKDDDLFASLTPRQREAATSPGPYTAVAAGPGSGKTLVLTRRIAYLIRACSVRPEMIAGITFTVRAAHEVKQRLSELLPSERALPFIGTFHAFGFHLLRQSGAAAKGILAEEEQVRFARETLRWEPASEAAKRLSRIARLKEEGKTPEEAEAEDPECAPYYRAYETAKCESGLWDLADLLLEPCRRLSPDHPLCAGWEHVCVDEFQDVNPLQLRFLTLFGGRGRKIFVIGDPNQAIYAFRGACSFAFERFRSLWPNSRFITLRENWRSTERILRAARAVLPASGRHLAEELQAVRSGGALLRIAEHDTPQSEGVWITRTIERLLGGTSYFAIDSGWASETEGPGDLTFGDFAVLYRTNAQGDILEDCFRKAGLPYRRIRSRPPCGDEAVRALLDRVQREVPVTHNAASLLEAAEGLRKTEALETLLARAESFQGTVQEFLFHLAFLKPEDTYREGSHVSLLTMHAAKGLQFRVVLVSGLGEGIFPPEPACDPEEEARLLYVAMTRAKDLLLLSFFRKGRAGRCAATGRRSPLLGRIPQDLILREKRRKRPKRPTWRQLEFTD